MGSLCDEPNLDEPPPFIRTVIAENMTATISSLGGRYKENVHKIFPFDSKFVKDLFTNLHVFIMGDSLSRAIYKDLIALLYGNELASERALKEKTEVSYMGDRQIDDMPLHADRVFRQAREFQTGTHLIQYLFTTRVMKDDVEGALANMCMRKEFPDVLLLNSCIWDLTRYNRHRGGAFGNMALIEPYQPCPEEQIKNERENMEEYLERYVHFTELYGVDTSTGLAMLLRRLRSILPPTSQVVWLCFPWPQPSSIKSAITRAPGAEETRSLHRSIYLDGNHRAAQVVINAGYDVLDMGFYLRNHALQPYRVKDGIHWDSVGTRIMTQLVVGHLAKSWGIPLPSTTRAYFNHVKLAYHNAPSAPLEGDDFLDLEKLYQYMLLQSVEFMKRADTNTTVADWERDKDEDRRGGYAEILQERIRDLALEYVEPEGRQAFIHDITTTRIIQTIHQSKCKLSATDLERLKTRLEAGSAVVKLLQKKPQTGGMKLAPDVKTKRKRAHD